MLGGMARRRRRRVIQGGVDHVTDRLRAATEAALLATARRTLAGARARVPTRTGRLLASGRVEKRDDSAVVVRFGGDGVEYAAAVHQDPTLEHDDGQWRFLSAAVADTMPGFRAAVSQAWAEHKP